MIFLLSEAPGALPNSLAQRVITSFFLFFNPHLRTCLDREEGREKRGEKHHCERETLKRGRNINKLPPVYTQTGDGTHDLGMCHDQESNLLLLGLRDDVPTN